MPATIATPAEIGGQVTEENVLVYHVTGPYAGMTLVNMKDDPTLPPAYQAGEIGVPPGSAAGMEASMDLMLTGMDDEELVNPPEAYPAHQKLILAFPLAPEIPPTVADVTIQYATSLGDPQTQQLALTEEDDLNYSTPIDIMNADTVTITARVDVQGGITANGTLTITFEPIVPPETIEGGEGGASTEDGGGETTGG